MKHVIRTAILFVIVFFVADFLCARGQTYLSENFVKGSWLTASENYEIASFVCYFWVYGFAGACLAWCTSKFKTGILLALSLGLATAIAHGVAGPIRPIFSMSHPTWLMELLSWVNWWVPPIASPIGAISKTKINNFCKTTK